jgi:hypothetical protein
MFSDLLILIPAAVACFALIALNRRGKRRDVPPISDFPPKNAIVVDGSNVMHWGGDPSLKVLARVLRSVEEKGSSPIVFFDANVGYKIGQRYYDAEALAPLIGVRFDHICVVDKGGVADEPILMFANDHMLKIVTNDRFRDWSDRFPSIRKKGMLVRGTFKNGNVSWHPKAWR